MTSHGASERCSTKSRGRRTPPASPAPAPRSCHGEAGLRDRSKVHLNDAEDFRKRWLLVFLLQQ